MLEELLVNKVWQVAGGESLVAGDKGYQPPVTSHYRTATATTISHNSSVPRDRFLSEIRSSFPWARLSPPSRAKIGTPYTAIPFWRRNEPSVAPRDIYGTTKAFAVASWNTF